MIHDTRDPFPVYEKTIAYFWSRVDKRGDAECWPWLGIIRKKYGIICAAKKSTGAHRFSFILKYGVRPGHLLVCHRCDNPICVNPSHLFLGSAKDNAQDAKTKGRTATGDRNGSRKHPERLKRGDENSSRKHPENMIRGDAHWTRQHPEKILRGKDSVFVTNPNVIKRGDQHHFRLHPERAPMGERNRRAKLNTAKVLEIRDLAIQGEARNSIAAKYQISLSAISSIVNRKTWKHI